MEPAADGGHPAHASSVYHDVVFESPGTDALGGRQGRKRPHSSATPSTQPDDRCAPKVVERSAQKSHRNEKRKLRPKIGRAMKNGEFASPLTN